MSDGLPASESKAGQYAAEAVERARVDIWKDEPPPLVLFESRAAWGRFSQSSDDDFAIRPKG
jgi:hypothetical protein